MVVNFVCVEGEHSYGTLPVNIESSIIFEEI